VADADAYRDPFDASWRERVVVLGGLGAALVIAYAIGMALAPRPTLELTMLVPGSFLLAGKFLPLWAISNQSQFGPYELGVVIWAMDTVTVLLIVYGLEAIYWIRPLKRWLDRVQINARLVLEAYPRMRRTATAGLVLFVMFPIAGTGAIGASFIGVLLGLHRARLIAAVSAGGLIGGMTMAFLAANFTTALRDLQAAQSDPTLKYLLVATVLGAVAAGVWLLTRAYRRALAEVEARQRAGD
jgi:uncharacterized membrane protein